MGIFGGISVGDLEKRARELNASANNLPYKLRELKNTNKELFEKLHKECTEIDKNVAEVILDMGRSSDEIARASKCAEIVHGILKRMGF